MSARPATRLHAARALVAGREVADLAIDVDAAGLVARLTPGAPPQPGDLRLGTVLPGSGNAHSHAFHRALRGRTHGGVDGRGEDVAGDFWGWRSVMYAVAGRLGPQRYGALAEAVFAEMLVAGWTAVAEFHYVHHREDGTPYAAADGGPNALGVALAQAATSVGLRLTLLDTLYLAGGPGRPLAPEQARFSDGSGARWWDRWQELDDRALGPAVTVGAAVHSVRAVAPDDIAWVGERLPAGVPLHVHLSEQVAENEQVLAAYGRTPTGVLAAAGVLGPRLSVVHATHLTERDVALLGDAHVTAVLCPTTEADLGDGLAPARELADAGAVLALGSDQNAVVDPWLEVRGLEAGERLRSRRRGRLSPAELEAARTTGGYRAAGLLGEEREGAEAGGVAVGAPADLVEVDDASVRTVGALLAQLPLVATAADVRRVLVGGRVVAADGLLADGRDPARLLADALAPLQESR